MALGQQERNAPQLLKATLFQYQLKEELNPDSLYSNLRDLEQWAQQEEHAVTRSILYSVLANQYAVYLARHSWSIRKIVPVDAEESPADIRLWDAKMFHQKIDECVSKSLQHVELLSNAKATDYVPFVETERKNLSLFFLHDLFHVIVKLDLESFHAFLTRADENERAFYRRRVGELYRLMLDTYRAKEGCGDAYTLSLLEYLEWQHGNSLLSAGDYWGRLKELSAGVYPDRSLVEVYVKMADQLQTEQRWSDLIQTLDEGISRCRKSKSVFRLKNLREEVLQQSVSLTYPEYVYPSKSFRLNVRYKHTEALSLKWYKVRIDSPEELSALRREGNLSRLRKKSRLTRGDDFKLSPNPRQGVDRKDLPYSWCDTTLMVMAPDEVGTYLLTTNRDKECGLLYVTHFYTVVLPLPDEAMEMRVLDSSTGHPVSGAEVKCYSQNDTLIGSHVTDDSGKCFIERSLCRISKGDDFTLQYNAHLGRGYFYASTEEKETRHLKLLTDRAIYRPGQVVYVKGIAYRKQAWKAHVCEQTAYTLQLLDANRKVVAEQQVRTNDFGSFTAQFTLPASCLNGNFTISTVPHEGSVSIRVEEYKRPTFDIRFETPSSAYAPGDTVPLRGNVKAFSGRSMQGAPLVYTIHHLRGYSWWNREDNPMVCDTMELDRTGGFMIPVPLVALEGGQYRIEASVADASGEYHRQEFLLHVAQTAYRFSLKMPEVLIKEQMPEVVVNVQNNSGTNLSMVARYALLRGGRVVASGEFLSGRPFSLKELGDLPSGKYRMRVMATYHQKEETTEKEFLYLSRSDRRLADETPLFVYAEENEFGEGVPGKYYLGTTCQDAYVMMDVFSAGRRISSQGMFLSDTLQTIEIPYRQEYGDGVTLLVGMLKDGLYRESSLAFTRKQPTRRLDIQWKVMRDRLLPGQQEEWRLVVNDEQGKAAEAEFMALLYDASLDRIYPFCQSLDVSFYPKHYVGSRHNMGMNYHTLSYSSLLTGRTSVGELLSYDRFCLSTQRHTAMPVGRRTFRLSIGKAAATTEVFDEVAAAPVMMAKSAANQTRAEEVDGQEKTDVQQETSLPPVDIRTDFAETAFFLPQLRTDREGEIVLSFTMPESVTEWQFKGIAHTRDMQTGMLSGSMSTSKPFMINASLPRFLRMGDRASLAASLSNLSPKSVGGCLYMQLFDPETDDVLLTRKKTFQLPSGETKVVSFDYAVPHRGSLIGVRFVAESHDKEFADGEQYVLPVLSNMVCQVEAVPLPIRGGEKRSDDISALFNHHDKHVQDAKMVVELTGNPAWTALFALPVLANPTSDNAIAWANAYYANTIVSGYLNSHAEYARLLDLFVKDKEKARSVLERNEDLKQVLLAETPWVFDAQSEDEQLERLSRLLDREQQQVLLHKAVEKLRHLQSSDGTWSWYKGMQGSHYVTSYITTLLLRLKSMSGTLDEASLTMLEQSMSYLHERARKMYEELQSHKEENTVLPTQALEYLYLVTLHGADIPKANRKCYAAFLDLLKRQISCEDMERLAKMAYILWMNGESGQAERFLVSLREHLTSEDELGAHFAFLDGKDTWRSAAIPAVVSMIEALSLTGRDGALVDELKIWLLKQKQVSAWRAEVETADAVYALLAMGSDWLGGQGDVTLSVADRQVRTSDSAIPGTKYVHQEFAAEDKKVMCASEVRVEKTGGGIAWGAVYARYRMPENEVKAFGSPDIRLTKELFVERVDSHGNVSLKPMKEESLLRGDKVIVRLVIQTNRSYDFLQLKDRHAACMEVIGALSGYQWKEGLGYYREVKDASVNFFLNHLEKGVHVITYPLVITHEGRYQVGRAEIQCAYAPEFVSHTAGTMVEVK
ncbi:MAG: alpha-2-macroglobulin family protein [Bacteroidales bacterium]|nr:alpha-2-macroglobulin family protein [Bacteroidales bacterium]